MLALQLHVHGAALKLALHLIEHHAQRQGAPLFHGAAGAVVIIVIVVIIVVVIGARGQRGQQRGGQGGMQGLKQEMAALHGRADCGSEKQRHRQQHERKAAQTLCV